MPSYWSIGLLFLFVWLGACGVSCPEGSTFCNETCVVLQTSPEHCGQCGTSCAAGEQCQAGVCGLRCDTGLTLCGLSCVNTSADSLHCGGCGRACAPNHRCEKGACQPICEAPQTLCEGVCTALLTTDKHCGACGVQCAAGERCQAGTCSLVCTKELSLCEGKCINLSFDPAHCGVCGHACPDEQPCAKGVCVGPCQAGLSSCASLCVDVKSNVQHCGACGKACASGQICERGACVTCTDCPTFVLQGEGHGSESVDSLAVDKEGNLYALVTFHGGKVVLDTLEGKRTILQSTGLKNFLVLKIDPSGRIEWVRNSQILYHAVGRSIAVDESGFVYISLFFEDFIEIDGKKHLAKGGREILLAKMDKAGKWLWSKAYGGVEQDQPTQMLVDREGNTYLLGSYQKSIEFGAHKLSAESTYASFVVQHNKDGVVGWVLSSSRDSSFGGIALDASGNLSLLGLFAGAFTLGGQTLTSSTRDLFLAKLDAKGAASSLKSFGWKGSFSPEPALQIDGQGNLYASGVFEGAVTLHGSNFSSRGRSDIWVAKWDRSSTLLWVRVAGGAGLDQVKGLALDSQNYLYIVGSIESNAFFGSIYLKAARDAYIAQLDQSGNWLGGFEMGGALLDEGRALQVDSTGNFYVGGSIRSQSRFGTKTYSSFHDSDMFIAKYNKAGGAICPSTSDYRMCEGRCTHLNSTLHCGACDIACRAGQACSSGVCR